MKEQRKKPELLIPASSLEVLKTAVAFGADAVYIEKPSVSEPRRKIFPCRICRRESAMRMKGMSEYMSRPIYWRTIMILTG